MAEKEYIEREEIMRAVDRAIELTSSEYDVVANEIDRIPAADVVEVVHTAWVWTEEGDADYDKYWVCTICGEKSYIHHNYCPNCGAKMDLED